MGGSAAGRDREKVETLPQMNNAIPRFEWEQSHTFYCIYIQEKKVACVRFEYFSSKFSKLLCHRSSWLAGEGSPTSPAFEIQVQILLEPGIKAIEEKLQGLVVYISVPPVLWRADLHPNLPRNNAK